VYRQQLVHSMRSFMLDACYIRVLILDAASKPCTKYLRSLPASLYELLFGFVENHG
jgi:hypothetical protein